MSDKDSDPAGAFEKRMDELLVEEITSVHNLFIDSKGYLAPKISRWTKLVRRARYNRFRFGRWIGSKIAGRELDESYY